MKIHTFEIILKDAFECEEQDGFLVVPSGTRLAVLVSSGDSIMPVARVRRVRITDDYVELVAEDERYFVTPMDLFALKQEDFEQDKAAPRPGFNRG
ncbi:MAG: hypothetical protein ACQEVA_04585 [Myxococcota bacterium]